MEVEGSLTELSINQRKTYHFDEQQTQEVRLPSHTLSRTWIESFLKNSGDQWAFLSRMPRYAIAITACGILLISLALILYAVWQTPSISASTVTTQQSISSVSMSTAVNQATQIGTIQVYIVGAIMHPGVYTLTTGARVAQLVQLAGGTTSNADTIALNLAAPLYDGQEVYVTQQGESSPIHNTDNATNTTGSISTVTTGSTTSGTPIDINTATETLMRQALHVSSVTANKIIAYRIAHGNYTAVTQLQLVVSKEIYKKIQYLITV